MLRLLRKNKNIFSHTISTSRFFYGKLIKKTDLILLLETLIKEYSIPEPNVLGDIVEEYIVADSAKVYLVKSRNVLYYMVKEPDVNPELSAKIITILLRHCTEKCDNIKDVSDTLSKYGKEFIEEFM
ncbi:MAG: hypothetical protein J7K21_04385, partial [Desulfurococcales archaeon]|nr:hypothetical protein [Desulfurococcales archaeon]